MLRIYVRLLTSSRNTKRVTAKYMELIDYKGLDTCTKDIKG